MSSPLISAAKILKYIKYKISDSFWAHCRDLSALTLKRGSTGSASRQVRSGRLAHLHIGPSQQQGEVDAVLSGQDGHGLVAVLNIHAVDLGGKDNRRLTGPTWRCHMTGMDVSCSAVCVDRHVLLRFPLKHLTVSCVTAAMETDASTVHLFSSNHGDNRCCCGTFPWC